MTNDSGASKHHSSWRATQVVQDEIGVRLRDDSEPYRCSHRSDLHNGETLVAGGKDFVKRTRLVFHASTEAEKNVMSTSRMVALLIEEARRERRRFLPSDIRDWARCTGSSAGCSHEDSKMT